jgi:hypothetical protein
VFPDPIPFVGLKTAKERLTRYRSEIEKGFSGSKSSGSTDGGTSSRVFGSFLSCHWAKGRARDAGAPVKSTPATPRGSRRVQSVN